MKNHTQNELFDLIKTLFGHIPFCYEQEYYHSNEQYLEDIAALSLFQSRLILHKKELFGNALRLKIQINKYDYFDIINESVQDSSNDKKIRELITEKARILAVVGIHENTCKPHIGTKTSVLFIQKWDDKLCPKKDDYPIFFAVSEKGGKDNSGKYVYVKNSDGLPKLDKHGHSLVEHDLHNHDGELPDGIGEAFIEFANSEKLSFWQEC